MSEKGIEYNWFEEKESLKELSFYKTSKGPHIFWFVYLCQIIIINIKITFYPR